MLHLQERDWSKKLQCGLVDMFTEYRSKYHLGKNARNSNWINSENPRLACFENSTFLHCNSIRKENHPFRGKYKAFLISTFCTKFVFLYSQNFNLLHCLGSIYMHTFLLVYC